MRKLSFKPYKIILILVIFLFFGVLTNVLINRDKPPLEELKLARESISNAKNLNADKFAKNLLDKSIEKYDSAMIYWNFENERFFLFRDFEKVKLYADESLTFSSAAINKSVANSALLEGKIKKEISSLQSKCKEFQNKFKDLPIPQIRKQFSKGKLILDEANFAFQNKNLQEANRKIGEARKIIDEYYKQANSILSGYFEHYNDWQKWISAGIEQSRKNKSYLVIINKYSRECQLYYAGKIKEKYEVELGSNWIGNKLYQGDKATPEGRYKIIKKKENGNTKYHKALLIDYPNEEDKARFIANKKSGLIASNKKIGSLIEIHGSGGQGADWTEGCIALSNNDMEKLFSKCSVGTPVIIVGSINNLNNLNK